MTTARGRNAHRLYEAEIRRVCEALDALIDRSPISRREIERRVGLSQGTLSKVLTAYLRLNYLHVLVILDVLGVDRGKFFAHLYAPEPPAAESLLEELMARLAQEETVKAEETGEMGEPSALDRMLGKLVEKAVRKQLAGLAGKPQLPTPKTRTNAPRKGPGRRA